MGAILAARESGALGGGHSAATAFVSGYSTALVIGAGVMLLGAVIAWRAFGRPAGPGEPVPQPA
jgi:hypothetical protein